MTPTEELKTGFVNDALPVGLSVYDDGGGAQLFFQANTDDGFGLVRYDGSNMLLVQTLDPLTDANPSTAVYDDGSGTKLYFRANTDVVEQGLFAYDGASVTLVDGTDELSPSDLTVYGDKLYFRGNIDAVGSEIFRYDGSGVTDYDIFRDGSSSPTSLVTYNPGPGERLYFGANTGDFRGQTQIRAGNRLSGGARRLRSRYRRRRSSPDLEDGRG